MTAIDALIVAAVAYVVYLVGKHYRALSEIGGLMGVWVALSGLIVIALLYLLDLATMYVLPPVVGHEQAMAAMTALHLEWSWLLVLPGVGLLVVGLAMLIRSVLPRLAQTIDELREARDEISANAQRFRELAEVASDWIWEADADDRLIYLTPGIRTALGVPTEQLLGKYRRDIIAEFGYESAAWPSHFEDIRARRAFRDHVFTRKMPDGSLTHIAIRGTPVYDDKVAFQGYRGVSSNITELVNARAELAKRQQLATIGQVTGTVSHELRNPLGTIHASSVALRQLLKGVRPEARSALQRIERNVQRCTRIIDELLSFAQQRQLELEEMDVAVWLDAVLDEIEVPREVSVERDFSPNVSARLASERLRQAIVNVVNNAVQSFDEGAAGTVQVSLRTAESRAVIAVHDDGPGMDSHTVARIFEPLFSTRTFGVGLGMPLVKRIMEQHGGNVEVTSEPGVGSTVSLWLPTSPAAITCSDRARTSDLTSAAEHSRH